MKSRPGSKPRFEVLDLLRGLAALMVLEWHYPWPAGYGPVFGRSYLAVDFFFVLSGFVLVHAYQPWLAAGASPLRFMRARLIRFYPLYGVAVVIGAAYWAGKIALGNAPGISWEAWWNTFFTAVLFLPTPPRMSVEPMTVFPFVYVTWSLFWELVVSAAYGVLATRLSARMLAPLIAIGAIGLCIAGFSEGSLDCGSDWPLAPVSFARALFSFFAGIAIWLLHKRLAAPRVPALLVATILLVFLAPTTQHGGLGYELAAVLIGFPLLVWLGASAKVGPILGRAGRELGYISYPVYILHAPLLAIWPALLRRVFGSDLAQPVASGLAIHLGFVLLLAWAIAHWFDEPVRHALVRRFVPDRPPSPAQTAP